MRLATLEFQGEPRVGVVGEAIVLLSADTEMLGLLALDAEQREAEVARRRTGSSVALREARLLTPLRPSTVRDFVTFEQHVEGIAQLGGPSGQVIPEWYEAPTFYFSNSNAMFGDGAPIAVPPGCEQFDFELEVAAVIGRGGRDLTIENAWEHIAAFTIFNDFSARDFSAREARMPFGFAKAKDFANVLGPWLVTADELASCRHDGRLHLQCVAYRNGERIGGDSLGNMAWSFEEMLVYASRGAELRTGDVLGSGTCGSGCLIEFWGRRHGVLEPRPLLPGDEVRLEVEGIGVLTNPVVAGAEPIPVPPARRGLGARP